MNEPTLSKTRRTRLSSTLFYIVLAGLVLCTIQSFRWTVEQYEQTALPLSQLGEATSTDWAVLLGMLEAPALLMLIVIALNMRNRAVLWLLCWLVLTSSPTTIMSAVSGGVAIPLIFGLFGLPLLSILLIMMYFCRTGEL